MYFTLYVSCLQCGNLRGRKRNEKLREPPHLQGIPPGFSNGPAPTAEVNGSQIFLRHLHTDPGPSFLFDTEGVSEIEYLLRQACGDIENRMARISPSREEDGMVAFTQPRTMM